MGHGLLLRIFLWYQKTIVKPALSRIASKKERQGKLLHLRQRSLIRPRFYCDKILPTTDAAKKMNRRVAWIGGMT
jgi:hypothetical protein